MNGLLASITTLLVLTTLGCSSEKSPESADEAAQPASASSNSNAPQLTGTHRLAGEGSSWRPSPHMHEWYDLTVATFAHGTGIDVDAYEAKVFEIFREFGRAEGIGGEAMVGHLKLLPRQMVDIVKEDPAVLKTYDDFWTAVAGPD